MSEIPFPDTPVYLLAPPFCPTPARANTSEWTGTRRITGQPGVAMWRANFAIETITNESDERPFRAFLGALDGIVNCFRLPIACQPHIGPRPVVAGATYTSLQLSGMQRDTHILEAGQYMTIPGLNGNHRLVMLTADLITDGSGSATAQFKPGLRQLPANGVQVETRNPFMLCQMATNEFGLTYDGTYANGQFEVVEATL